VIYAALRANFSLSFKERDGVGMGLRAFSAKPTNCILSFKERVGVRMG